MKQQLTYLGVATAGIALLTLLPSSVTTTATASPSPEVEFDYCVDATSDYVGFESGQEACRILGVDLQLDHWEDGSWRFLSTSGPNKGVWWIGCDGTLCDEVAA